MGWKRNMALCAIIVFIGLIAYEYKVRNSGPDCASVTFEQATKTITDDYLMRMQYWHQEAKKLGTDKPDLSFDQYETQVKDVYFVPFTAIGPMGSKMRFAMFTCKSGSIEYSEQ